MKKRQNMAENAYNLIIIGSGAAGMAALQSASESGSGRIAMIESYRRLGGECPNWGCMPTKSLLQTVDILEHCGRGAEFGVPNCGGLADFRAARLRQRQVIDSLTGGPRLANFVKESGADLIRGRAKFVGPNEIEVNGQKYYGKKFVVAVGTETFIPTIPGLDGTDYLTAAGALALEEAPKSMVIIGGGPIGVEFSKIFSVFGTKVTVIESSEHILPNEDHDIAAIVSESLISLGITLLPYSDAVSVSQSDGKVTVTVSSKDGSRRRRITADKVVVAAGKRHLWGEIGAEAAGIKLTGRGAPVLNEFLQTSNRAVYSAGDCSGRMMFTSVAHREGEAAGMNATKGNRHKVDLRVVPRGTYGDPEVGSVGLTEEQAIAIGRKVAVGIAPFSVLSKSIVTSEPIGMVKLVCDRKTKEIIGGHVVGHSASEIVHTIAVSMQARMKCVDLAEMIYAFPTYSEAIRLAAINVQ